MTTKCYVELGLGPSRKKKLLGTWRNLNREFTIDFIIVR